MKYLFSYLIIFFPLFLFAQNLDYTLSEPYKEVPEIQPDKKWYFSDQSKENILSAKFDRGLLYLQLFDARTMKETQLQKVSGLPKRFELSRIDQIQDKIFVFYTVWNRKQKSYQLFAHEVDIKKCQLKPSPQKLLEVDETVSLSYLYSSDHKNLLVYYRKRPKEKRDAINHDIIGLHTFNQNLDRLGSKEVEMPYTEKEMDNIAYCIDNDGTPYILAMHHQDSRLDIKYHLELIKYNLSNGKTKITKIEPEVSNLCAAYHRGNYHLYEGGDNHIHLVEIYNNNQKTKASEEGIALVKIAKEGSIVDRKLYPISIETLNQYEDAKTQKQNKSENPPCKNFMLRKVSIQPNNSILYTIEQHYQIIQSTENGTSTTSYYEDVYLVKINAEEELAWVKKLPKNQVGGKRQGGLGLKHLTIDNDHYLFFLDNIKNMDLDLNKSPEAHSDRFGGFLTAYKVDDATGNVDKYSLFDTRDAKGLKVYQFGIDRIVPVFENEFIMEFYVKRRKDVLIKVKIKG